MASCTTMMSWRDRSVSSGGGWPMGSRGSRIWRHQCEAVLPGDPRGSGRHQRYEWNIL